MRRLLICASLALSCSSSPAPKKLVILHTNDEHSHLIGLGPEIDDFPRPANSGTGIKGGASRRSVVLKGERDSAKAAGADTLTVSAGDNMMGSLTQIAATNVSADYRIMKVLGYDVTTLGNHEFDYGPNSLATIIQTAQASPEKLPVIVASNTHFSGTANDAALQALFDANNTDSTKPIHGKYVITTPNGLKVGFVGIMGADAQAVAPAAAPGCPQTADLRKACGVTFSQPSGTTPDNRIASLAQIYDDIQPYVDSLRRDDKVDLVIALSHGGADPNAPESSEDVLIAENVSGIDVIVSGHSHTDFRAQLFKNKHTSKEVLVQQAGRFGDQVGRISLSVDTEHHVVSFDVPAANLVPVGDTTVGSDATVDTLVDQTVGALETVNIPGQQFSFLKYTLSEILGGPPPAYANLGDYYNFNLGSIPFDVDNSARLQETPLLDLIVDSDLANVNALGFPTDLSAAGYGATRVPALKQGKTSRLGFADLFAAVPLGGSPASGTPGYPLCRFALYFAEVKAAFEVTAAFAYQSSDFFVVPSGFKFQYDTTRAPYNSSGDPTDRNNGRVVKIWQLKPSALAAGIYDGPDATTWDLKFDASMTTAAAPGLPVGWLDNPLKLVKVVTNYYIASFATFAGVKLKALHDTMPSLADGAPVPGNDPTATILKRPAAAGGTELKEWETVGAYVHAQAGVPSRYDKTTATFPRRAICVGANATNGTCSH
jgi:5'-nucleotidase